MITNFAKRAHDHNFRADPIIRSLLDTDFYKLLMLQFIWRHFADVPVEFAVINRTASVRLAEVIDEAELRRQLDHARSLSFTRSQLVWLAGNTFYNTRGMFEPRFIEWLADYRLPPYTLTREDGQYKLSFSGRWLDVTLWEIPAVSILNELKTRAALADLSEFELDILYARAKTRLWEKIERLRAVKDLSFVDFGTRRRHSFLWQDHVVQLLGAELPGAFTGTSNTHLAFRHDLEAKGTNAHELPMVMTALFESRGEDLKPAQYEVLRLWQDTYGGALKVMLPDTYGSTQFLKDSPDWVADWTGIRCDSKEPVTAGEEYIAYLQARGRDPRDKLLLFSDGLDIDTILALHARFHDRIRVSFGWGTLLTNDFRDCHPRGRDGFDPISLVCKVVSAAGQPAVKLSDNYLKATGPKDAIERYRAVFGLAGVGNIPVTV